MTVKCVRHCAVFAIAMCVVDAGLQAQDARQVFGLLPVTSTKLYYEVAGEGPAVVLLHGGWLNSRQWDDQFSALSREYRVVRYDVRGAGRSALGDSAYAQHEDLATLLSALGIERPHLIGLSAGSQLAIDFALSYPHAVHSLVIGASPLRGYDLGKEFTDGMRGVISAGVADSLQLTHDRMWAFAPFRVASTMPQVRQRLNAMILHQNTWSANRPNRPRPKPLDPPSATRLGEIRLPVLVVVGDGEMPALKKEAEFVASSIPGAKLLAVKDAGHFVNLEQPDQYNKIILDWLTRVGKR